MINTCSYKNYKSNFFKTYSISGNRGRDAGYEGLCFQKLAPKLSFFQIWKNNKGIISEEENTKYYIEQYYLQVLSKLNPEDIYKELDNSILLCYENNDEFCHRHIVAAWFELLLGVECKEVVINELGIKKINKPDYIKQYLEEIIKNNSNMKGFNSLRALYMFEKGEKLEQQANEFESKTGKSYDSYRQMACYLRCEADEEEAKYDNVKKLLKL